MEAMRMVRVYFGPYKHSPAPELPADERFLWLRDMHLLKGFDQDFWTCNPLHLDQFDRSQIMLWCGTGWEPMPEVMRKLGLHLAGYDALPPGPMAIMCEMVMEAREAAAAGEQATQP
jgi:hypothetical protein